MPFEPELDERLGRFLAGRDGFERKIMFGGPGYMLNGKMCVGVYKHFLVVRLGKANFETLSERYDELRVMDFTGRAMSGWGMIDGFACDEECFAALVNASEAFVRSLT